VIPGILMEEEFMFKELQSQQTFIGKICMFRKVLRSKELFYSGV
jgi:hypothetical protein